MEKAYKLINELKIKDEYVVLACSYGPDSMVLLDILMENKINIIVAHVNHKIRKQSDDEEKLLEKFCLDNNLILEKKIIINYPKGNFENNARKIRYNFFETILKKYNSKYLFTAHHGDDLIETILMRLTRGSSLKGYGGFGSISIKNNHKIIRPLIFYTKEEIFSYTKRKNIQYAIDHTNNEEIYMRNKYRINILPILKQENINVHKQFLKFSKEIQECENYFEEKTTEIYKKVYLNNILDLNSYKLLEPIFQKRILNQIMMTIYKNEIYLINDKHTSLITNLINSEKKNTFIELPNNIKVFKLYNKLEFNFKHSLDSVYDYILDKKQVLNIGTITVLEQENNDKSNFTIRLNSGEFKLPLHVRTALKGDKVQVKNLLGTKKISDIFINEKLNIIERNNQPLVTDADGAVLWVPGIKKSIYDKQINQTYDIIIKYKKKEKANEK